MAIVFAGYNPDRSPFLLLEFHNMTGLGGGPRMDGQEAGPYCLGNVANVSVEVIEAESPVMVEEYAFLPDTGGPGTHRGALGIVRQFRLLAEKATVQVRSERQKQKPGGLQGDAVKIHRHDEAWSGVSRGNAGVWRTWLSV